MSIKFNNSFLDFYQYIIPVATDYARRNPQFMGKDMFIRSCVGEAVDCQHCTTRIGGDINIAWTLCITHKCWALQFTNEELEAARIPGGYPVDVL
jgi:hypothetical protein